MTDELQAAAEIAFWHHRSGDTMSDEPTRVPCTCPRPTLRLEQAIDRLNEMPPSPEQRAVLERHRSDMERAMLSPAAMRGSTCVLCLGKRP